MKRWIKWTSGTVVVLALAAVGAAVVGQQMAERKRQRVISVPVTAVPYAEGAQVLARGKYLYESRGCVDCHGLQGAGRTFLRPRGDRRRHVATGEGQHEVRPTRRAEALRLDVDGGAPPRVRRRGPQRNRRAAARALDRERQREPRQRLRHPLVVGLRAREEARGCSLE